jgi:hypothetical protein
MKRTVLMLILAWALQPVGAMERGMTELGRPFVSGGVGLEEASTLNDEKSHYALAILTATKGSGMFLAGVRVRITDEKSKQVLDTVMDGPWLLVDLAPGRYQVEALENTRTQTNVVTFGAGDHCQTVFYFIARDEGEPN